MSHRLRSRLLLGSALVAALVGLYAVLGFYVAPKVIRSQAVEFVRSQYGRDLRIGEVRLNPFTLQLEVRDVALPDADQRTLLGFRRLFVDFELSSLWHRAYTFRDIDIDAPTVRAVVRPDGRVNLADLAPKKQPTAGPPPPREALPAVWIQSLVVRNGLADFVDEARARVYARRFEPIEFNLSDFRTTPHGGDFGFSAVGRGGARFDYKGHFALEPGITSQGQFSVGNLAVTDVAEFLGDAVPFDLTAGTLRLGGNYRVAFGGKADIEADLPKIEATGLALRARGVDADWVQVPSLVLSDTRLALPEQTVAIGNVTLSNLAAQAWRSADGSVNLSRLFSPAALAPAAPEAAAPAGEAKEPASPWRLKIGGIDLRAAKIDFEDRSVSPAAVFSVAPLDGHVKEVSLDLAQPLPVEFGATINGRGSIKGSGRLVPRPLSADVDVTVDNFDLADLQPYVAAATDMTVRAGSLGTRGKLTLAPTDGPSPGLSYQGDVTVSAFRSVDNALEQDFCNFERLELGKLRYDLAPAALTIDRVRLVRPFNRVIIGSNRIVNVAAVFDPAGTAAELKRRAAEAEAASAAAGRKKTRAEVRADRRAAAAAAKARAKAPPAPQPELKETGMRIRIREFRLESGRLDFADYSIQPNFAADVTALNGTVRNMSSDPKSRSRIEFKGKVGEFSPVTISGDVQPFAFERYTDVGMKFENISLPIFNPYSGRFAGYSISQGKLTTDLHYTITDRKLDAKHHVRIDQLEWGAATATKGEATLPVKFATSLLKDANGVIELDIPVKGTLDDPKFRIGPIIWQIVKNILTKAVTAPFRALGALFKDAEQAQFVDFAPGQATLDAATAERLAGLAKTLAGKPDIRIKVPIGALADADLPALTDQRYAAEVEAATRRVVLGRKAALDAPVPAFDSLEPGRQIDVLENLAKKITGAEPQLPPPPERAEGESRKDAKAAEQAAAIDFLRTTVRSRLTPGAGELEQLATSRSEAVQHALLTDTGLAPERVFSVKDGKVTPQDGKVRFELAME